MGICGIGNDQHAKQYLHRVGAIQATIMRCWGRLHLQCYSRGYALDVTIMIRLIVLLNL